MTFKLYRIEFNNEFYYDYSINDLAGTYDHRLLTTLITTICDSTSLILASCEDFADFYAYDDNTDRNVIYPPIFIATYKNSQELRSNLRRDLQQQFPEEFV